MSANPIKVIDLRPGEYIETPRGSPTRHNFPLAARSPPTGCVSGAATYAISEFTTVPLAHRGDSAALNTLKSLQPQQMFVLDRTQHIASTWVSRWGKKLGRKFVTHQRSAISTEIYRVE